VACLEGNTANFDDHTPFSVACLKGDIIMVQYLALNQRIDLNKPGKYGSTPFYQACCQGKVDVVKYLASDQRVDINKGKDECGTPLWIACYVEQKEIVKSILASRSDVDVKKICTWKNTTAGQQARAMELYSLANLLEEYQRDPFRTAIRLKKELRFDCCLFHNNISQVTNI